MIDMKELKKLANNFCVLYVEDDELIRKGVIHYLESFFKRVDSAVDGQEGLEVYKNGDYDLVITDIEMPRMDGLNMARKIKDIDENQDILIISAYADNSLFMDSIRIGISGYIIKPVDFQQINEVLYKVLYKLQKFKENELYKKDLEHLVAIKTNEQRQNYEKTILSLVTMIEERDTYTGGHSERVAKYSKLIAEELGYSKKICDLIYRAGILHDIGKITTPDSILLKPGKLNDLEYKIIQEHVTMSRKILEKIPMYEKFIDIIEAHHEHFDGSGYPKKLKGDEVPSLSRIMIVADAFDAMTTSRIYKGKKSVDEAIQEIKELSGISFHPEVVDSAVKVLSTIEINDEINQLPKSELEEERFAYFYKDQLTGLNNQNYLDLILSKNEQSKEYTCLAVIALHNFAQYNLNKSWMSGDKFLKSFSKLLKDKFPQEVLFRIHGDDFILLGNWEYNYKIDDFSNDNIFKNTKLSLSINKFDIFKNKIFSLKDLEQIII